MSASFSKRQLAALAPATISAASVDVPRRRRSGTPFGRALAWLAGRRGRGAVLNELNALSARELADIGLSRSDIHRVFDPAFAAEHAARG